MEKFNTGFAKGDIISNFSVEQILKCGLEKVRYVNVWNAVSGKDYTVGDNGERRERIFKDGSIKFGKLSKGNLPYKEIV
jgi:hypothetical protein